MTLIDLDRPLTFYYVTFAALVLVYVRCSRPCCRSRFGHALAGITGQRAADARARASRPIRYKLAAFVLAGALGRRRRLPVRGEGRLRESRDPGVAPVGHGAADADPRRHRHAATARCSARSLFVVLKELFQSEALFGGLARHWQLPLGLTIIALRRADAQRRNGFARAAAQPSHGRPPMLDEVLLAARRTVAPLRRPDGRRSRVARRSCAARCTRSSAPTAPASRRSSTCSPASCRRHRDASQLPARRHALVAAATRARRHRPQLPAHERSSRASTVFENCRLDGAGHATSTRCDLAQRRSALRREHARSPHRAIEQAGLDRRRRPRRRHAVARPEAPARDRDGASRPHRRCCCSTSRSPAWAPRKPSAMLGLLAALKPGHAILLVEHDMDAVFRIADRITVMVNGAVIATGDAGRHPQRTPTCRPPTSASIDVPPPRRLPPDAHRRLPGAPPSTRRRSPR